MYARNTCELVAALPAMECRRKAGRVNSYDRKALEQIKHWKERRQTRRVRNLIPQRVRDVAGDRARALREFVESAPGFEEVELAIAKALQALGEELRDLAVFSIRRGAIVRAYQRRGHTVNALPDIRQLELADVDAVIPPLSGFYRVGAGIQGAAAGIAISGGELFAAGETVVSLGVGAAPGAAQVFGIMVADAAASLAAASRVVAHTAAYYGYDPTLPDEQLYMLACLSLGSAGTQAEKSAAFLDLNALVQGLVRGQTWAQLNEHATTKVVRRVYEALTLRLTKQRLAMALPVVGIVAGAGLNSVLIRRSADGARYMYRERFLCEKYGLHPQDAGVVNASDPPGPSSEDRAMSMVEIIEGVGFEEAA
jgi:hypothetical protein